MQMLVKAKFSKAYCLCLENALYMNLFASPHRNSGQVHFQPRVHRGPQVDTKATATVNSYQVISNRKSLFPGRIFVGKNSTPKISI